MKKSAKVGEHIKALRLARDMTQSQLAHLLDVRQTTVSAWELDENLPSSEAWVKLGNFAPYPDCIWFWQQAGMDEQAMLSAAEKLLKGRRAAPGEITCVPRSSGTLQESEEAGPLVPLPAEFVPNPLSTRCLVVDEKFSNPIFPVGDVILLDESANSPEDLRPFWGEIVLVHLTRPKDGTGLRMTKSWRDGLNIGRLLCRTSQSGDRLQWAATLGPFDDADKWYTVDGRRIFVGTWRHEFRSESFGAAVDSDRLREAREEAKLQAPMQMRLTPGCRILGRVIGWFRAPR